MESSSSYLWKENNSCWKFSLELQPDFTFLSEWSTYLFHFLHDLPCAAAPASSVRSHGCKREIPCLSLRGTVGTEPLVDFSTSPCKQKLSWATNGAIFESTKTYLFKKRWGTCMQLLRNVERSDFVFTFLQLPGSCEASRWSWRQEWLSRRMTGLRGLCSLKELLLLLQKQRNGNENDMRTNKNFDFGELSMNLRCPALNKDERERDRKMVPLVQNFFASLLF